MNGKQIVFSAISNRFAGYKLKEIFLTFVISENICNVILVNTENKKIESVLDKSDMTMIKMMFVNKFIKQVKKEKPEIEIKNIIVHIVLETEQIKIYYDCGKGDIIEFNY